MNVRRIVVRVAQSRRLALLAPAISAGLIYLHTLAPGVTGLDSAELASGAFTLGIVHPTGYPLYLLFAHWLMAIPVGSIAFRANLVSALFGSLCVFVVGVLCWRLTGRAWAAGFASLLLAVAVSFWKMALVAEVYTLHAFMTALVLLCAERSLATRQTRWLIGMAFLFGLSLTNHVSSILYAPVVLWATVKSLPGRRIVPLGFVLAFVALVGLTPYLYLPLRAASNPPLDFVRDYYGIDLRTLSGVWWMISGQAYRFFAFSYDSVGYLRELAYTGALLWRTFTGFGVGLGLVGAISLIRQRNWLILPTGWVLFSTLFFFAGYGVSDKETMLLPAYLTWSLWVSVGAVALSDGARMLGKGARVVEGYARATVVCALAGLILLSITLNWAKVDMSGSIAAEQQARRTLEVVQPNALVRGGWSGAVVLEYLQQVEGLRPDVAVFNESRYEVAEYYRLWRRGVPYEEAIGEIRAVENEYIRQAYAHRPVYDLKYDPVLAREFEYRPLGTVFWLRSRDRTSDT